MPMKTVLLSAALLTGALSSAFAATPAPSAGTIASPHYTAGENKELSYCMWLSSAAYVIAGYKIHGDPASVPKKFYSSDPQSDVLLPLVTSIYGDKVLDAWDYAGDFYSDCASSIGKIAPERSAPSAICMHATLVAATARNARAGGTPKEKVYALYASKGPLARKIIDDMYAPAAVPAQGTELQTWSDCMAGFSKP
jgi:hypothetical protein